MGSVGQEGAGMLPFCHYLMKLFDVRDGSDTILVRECLVGFLRSRSARDESKPEILDVSRILVPISYQIHGKLQKYTPQGGSVSYCSRQRDYKKYTCTQVRWFIMQPNPRPRACSSATIWLSVSDSRVACALSPLPSPLDTTFPRST